LFLFESRQGRAYVVMGELTPAQSTWLAVARRVIDLRIDFAFMVELAR
jgi:hypothetical protein